MSKGGFRLIKSCQLKTGCQLKVDLHLSSLLEAVITLFPVRHLIIEVT